MHFLPSQAQAATETETVRVETVIGYAQCPRPSRITHAHHTGEGVMVMGLERQERTIATKETRKERKGTSTPARSQHTEPEERERKRATGERERIRKTRDMIRLTEKKRKCLQQMDFSRTE